MVRLTSLMAITGKPSTKYVELAKIEKRKEIYFFDQKNLRNEYFD
jgi:hypothetical protein